MFKLYKLVNPDVSCETMLIDIQTSIDEAVQAAEQLEADTIEQITESQSIIIWRKPVAV